MFDDADNLERILRVQVEPIMVRRDDAARLLSISPRKLDEWVSRGLIARWKVDGVVRFSIDELRAFLRSQGAT